jgi:hypothetical protein
LLRIVEPPKKKRRPRDPNEAAPPEIPRITERDVQRLRFAEINLPRTDLDRARPAEFDRVPVEFTADARQRFWKQMQGKIGFTEKQERVDFFKMSATQQLGIIATQTGWDYQRDVKINGDPQVFKTFKTRVWPLLKAGCATSGCHGGPNSTAFRFLVDNDANTEVLYTNFLILNTIAVDNDRMIDRDRPRDSLLLTYCLPQDKSLKPHPAPPEIRPALRNPQDPRYEVIHQWILSLRNPHPDYAIDLIGFPQDLRPPPSALELPNDPNEPDNE